MVNHISFPGLGIELEISRAAFSIFGMDIYTYGILIAAGLLLAFWYAVREADRVWLRQDDLLNMFIIAVPAAIVCARLYYVVFSWGSYKNDLLSIFDIRSGGLAIYGGVIGAVLAVYIYCRVKNVNIGTVLDILAVGLLIGQAVGRWGNFVNGEAFGSSTTLPWAMTIVCDGKTVTEGAHPTFLYESLWNAAGIAVLLAYKRKTVFRGELFCGYMVWYGIGRTLIEGLRTDSLYWGAIRVSQLLSAALVIAGIALILVNRRKARLKNKNAEEQRII